MKRMMTRGIPALLIGLAALFLLASCGSSSDEIVFRDVKKQTHEFIGYYRTIQLSAEQAQLKADVLGKIPAVCCDDFSALTCCCECNFSKALWGLTHHLIAERGYDAQRLRQSVDQWVAFTNPNGYSGKACHDGGCMRPFARDGCGGMSETHVIF
jgi:hypothetical protein